MSGHDWTPDQIERRARVEAGGTVVAYLTRDKALVAWARGPDAPPTEQDREWRRGIEVYIGNWHWWRPVGSGWGNRYKVKLYGRERAIALYRADILERPDLLARLLELRGRVLTCWCHPLPCHGDAPVELLDRLEERAT